MKLTVGFITYNEITAKYLADFLASLKAALTFLKNEDFQVYVFDNSDKGNLSNSRALTQYQNIKYFCLGYNLGFARAYNILIRKAIKTPADYFLVINPDTIIEPDAIKRLVAALDNDDKLASVAPKILRWDFVGNKKTQIVDSLGLTLRPGLKFVDLGQGREDEKTNRECSIMGPSGAAGLFRLCALQKVAEIRDGSQDFQFYDERFFMYKEDCDLAYRLFLADFKSQLIPEAVIYHDRTAAVSGQGIWDYWRGRQTKSEKIRAWSFRNQHLIFLKYWEKQNFVNKIIIIFRVLLFCIFSLILEQFLLKEYSVALRRFRGLTNVK